MSVQKETRPMEEAIERADIPFARDIKDFSTVPPRPSRESKVVRLARIFKRLDGECSRLEARLYHMKPGSPSYLKTWRRYCELCKREIRLRDYERIEQEKEIELDILESTVGGARRYE